MFEIFIRSSNRAPWRSYGVFRSEAEWQRELPYLQALQEVTPVYLKRIRLAA